LTRDLQVAFKNPYLSISLQNYAGSRQAILSLKNINIPTLAKARLGIENIKGSNLVTVRHTIDQL
jgi:hypothetical protein